MKQQQHISFRKKAGVVLAIIAVLLPAWYAVDFLVERSLHRMEMYKKMEQSMLQTIRLDSASIQWKKQGRELIINNEYFDVASIRYENGIAIISGIFDERETAMHAAFAKAQQQQQSNDGDSSRMAQWLLKHWLAATHYTFTPGIFTSAPQSGCSLASMHLQIHSLPLTPPPQLKQVYI